MDFQAQYSNRESNGANFWICYSRHILIHISWRHARQIRTFARPKVGDYRTVQHCKSSPNIFSILIISLGIKIRKIWKKYVLDHRPIEEVSICFGEDEIKSNRFSKGRCKSVPPFLTPSQQCWHWDTNHETYSCCHLVPQMFYK